MKLSESFIIIENRSEVCALWDYLKKKISRKVNQSIYNENILY